MMRVKITSHILPRFLYDIVDLLPVDWLFTLGLKECVCLNKVATAEESVVG